MTAARWLLVGAVLVVSACGRAGTSRVEADLAFALTGIAVAAPVAEDTEPDPPLAPPPTPTPEPTPAPLSPLAELVTPVGSSTYDPAEHQPSVAPVSLTIDGIRVSDAPVTAVGVRPDGEMDVPPASEVGWYRFGPSPGESGSAVLAAHIAFDGVDGVFRNLDAIELGAQVEVGYADGTTAVFEVVDTAQYDKAELPFDDIFTSDGDPSLTLITCGGDFNRSISSYEDNVVAYAVPVAG